MKHYYILIILILMPFFSSCELTEADSTIKTEQGYHRYYSWNAMTHQTFHKVLLNHVFHVNAILTASSDSEREALIREFYYNGNFVMEGSKAKLYIFGKDNDPLVINTNSSSLESNNTTWNIALPASRGEIQELGLVNSSNVMHLTITRKSDSNLEIKTVPSVNGKDYYITLNYHFIVNNLPKKIDKFPYDFETEGKIILHPYALSLSQLNYNTQQKATHFQFDNPGPPHGYETDYIYVYTFNTTQRLHFDGSYWTHGNINFNTIDMKSNTLDFTASFFSNGVNS
ncbi:hypothetical protein N9251_02070, partial [Gammaproteobacteria bacterium]|nr:hypothetical protein [Gammaproteobacteria bacterium]